MSDHFNELSPAEQERLAILAEECADADHCGAKIGEVCLDDAGKPCTPHASRIALAQELEKEDAAVAKREVYPAPPNFRVDYSKDNGCGQSYYATEGCAKFECDRLQALGYHATILPMVSVLTPPPAAVQNSDAGVEDLLIDTSKILHPEGLSVTQLSPHEVNRRIREAGRRSWREAIEAAAKLNEEAEYIAQQYRLRMGSSTDITERNIAIEEMRRVDKFLAAIRALRPPTTEDREGK